MRGVFEDEEVELSQQRRETELTLTSTTLLGIFFGMVLLCGLFFGLGFALGRHGSGEPKPANLQTSTAAPSASTAASSRPKPSASAQNSAEPQRAVVNLPSDETSNANPADNSQHSESAPAPASFPSHPLVKPALLRSQIRLNRRRRSGLNPLLLRRFPSWFRLRQFPTRKTLRLWSAPCASEDMRSVCAASLRTACSMCRLGHLPITMRHIPCARNC